MSSYFQSPYISSIDRLRGDKATVFVQTLGIAIFVLFTALGAQIRIQIWEVPFTLQTLAVYGSGLFLGWRNGIIAQLLYLSIGLLLPVYANGQLGPAYLFGALSAGYLLAFPLASGISGILSTKWNSLAGSMISLVAGSFVLFFCGVTWLHFAAGHSSWTESIINGWLRFLPIDLIKISIVALTYQVSRKLF